MIGAILGDIVGSIYEFDNIKTKEFDYICGFTSYFWSKSTVFLLKKPLKRGNFPKVYLPNEKIVILFSYKCKF